MIVFAARGLCVEGVGFWPLALVLIRLSFKLWFPFSLPLCSSLSQSLLGKGALSGSPLSWISVFSIVTYLWMQSVSFAICVLEMCENLVPRSHFLIDLSFYCLTYEDFGDREGVKHNLFLNLKIQRWYLVSSYLKIFNVCMVLLYFFKY